MNSTLKIQDFLDYEFYISKKLKLKTIDLFVFIIVTIFCIFMRAALFPFASNDYNGFLTKWFDFIQKNGVFKALSISIGDYTPPYFYILSALTYIPIDSLISIKLVSCIFDFALAIAVMKIVYIKYKSVLIGILAYSITLIVPTVLLNSAYWAQCDVIFTLFLVLCIYAFIKDKPLLATSFFAISFCFKLQAVFLAPFLVLMWLKNKMKFRHFFAIPAIYIVSIIPSAIAGRSIWDLLTVYIKQSGQYNKMSLNAPNLYMLISDVTDKTIGTAAVFICFTIVLIVLYVLMKKDFRLTPENIVILSLFFAILVPFFLPYMHERYFYVADVLSIIFAFYFPKKFYISIMIIFSSLCTYIPYLFGVCPINLNYAAIIMLFALIFVALELKNNIKIFDK